MYVCSVYFPCRSWCVWHRTPSPSRPQARSFHRASCMSLLRRLTQKKLNRELTHFHLRLFFRFFLFFQRAGLWCWWVRPWAGGLRPDWKTGAQWIDQQQWLVVFVYPFAQLPGPWRCKSIHHDFEEMGGMGVRTHTHTHTHTDRHTHTHTHTNTEESVLMVHTLPRKCPHMGNNLQRLVSKGLSCRCSLHAEFIFMNTFQYIVIKEMDLGRKSETSLQLPKHTDELKGTFVDDY